MPRAAGFRPRARAARETFGVAVSISGKVLVVGASAARIGNNAAQGAAYLFGAQ
ncbi:MAG: FG-GAP repeat protein [Acidobacteriia bacterium]|nr:FG-GAP repeat protein [Terriglobia bacterium]